jgi:hypothetical protein
MSSLVGYSCSVPGSGWYFTLCLTWHIGADWSFYFSKTGSDGGNRFLLG